MKNTISQEELFFHMKYENPAPFGPGSVGVCLDDEGENIQLYEIDTIYIGDPTCWEIDVYPIGVQMHEDAPPRSIKAAGFWCLFGPGVALNSKGAA